VQVVSDRPDYHSEDLIFPVGYCSTRVYGSLKDPERKCVYTCKIVDGGTAPRYVANVLVYFLSAKPGSYSCYEKVFSTAVYAFGMDVNILFHSLCLYVIIES
jgi:hypothetical protein